MLGKEASAVLVATLVLVLPLALAPVALGAPAGDGDVLLVTMREGARGEDVARRAGATLENEAPGLGVAIVRAAPGVEKRLARDPDVLGVERDATVRAASATWNSASWNSASWNSASWNSASWNSASWNGAEWNSASWNSASWNGAEWNSASWNSASWNSASWNSASWNGAQWNSASWNEAGDGGTQWNGGAEGGLAPPWGHLAIRAPEAWASGVPVHNRLVCMVDTGVDAAHPALAPNLAATYNVLAPGAPAHDESGHGTHLAGIVAAIHDDAWPVPGVSQARIAVAKALDENGFGLTSDVIVGLDWCREQDADVVLLAFSEDAPTKAFRSAVSALQRSGALVVASAGNGGCDRCVGAPADLPGVLAVAAADPDGRPAAFNSRGPQVDLLAPGVLITSAYPGDSMRTGSGTSQAAAYAAGAAAFVWGHAPDMHAQRVAAALVAGSDGHGRLDVASALAHAQGAA